MNAEKSSEQTVESSVDDETLSNLVQTATLNDIQSSKPKKSSTKKALDICDNWEELDQEVVGRFYFRFSCFILKLLIIFFFFFFFSL